MAKRTHKAKVEALNARLTPTEIRANKCAKSHARNEERKQKGQETIKARLTRWRKLSFEEQLTELDKRPGKSTKQRQKIQERIDAAKSGNSSKPKKRKKHRKTAK